MSQPASTREGDPAERASVEPSLRRNFSVIIPALNESESIPELF